MRHSACFVPARLGTNRRKDKDATFESCGGRGPFPASVFASQREELNQTGLAARVWAGSVPHGEAMVGGGRVSEWERAFTVGRGWLGASAGRNQAGKKIEFLCPHSIVRLIVRTRVRERWLRGSDKGMGAKELL